MSVNFPFPSTRRLVAHSPYRDQAYKTLNRLQSIVFPVAYGSNENMLVCAPTGAVRPCPQV